ncbi:MAG: tyrosine-type recombinase/integrase [Turneriella sp.]|nr:tyrosine-type recombinase/integrase [Turneriella sp.]
MTNIIPMNVTKKNAVSKFSQVVRQLVDLPELQDLNDRQLEDLAKAVLIDRLKESLNREVDKAKLKPAELRARWLNQFDSQETQRSFSWNLEYFLAWFGARSILDVDSKVVDDYVSFLRSTKTAGRIKAGVKVSDNTIRQRIAACSSFWKSLKRWDIVANNPWLGCKMPKKRIAVKKAESVPEDRELDLMEGYCRGAIKAEGKGSANKMQGAKLALGALKVLRATGLRVGGLPTLSIDANGFYTAISKGGQAHGKLEKKVIDSLGKLGMDKKRPFANYHSFSMYFNRLVAKLNFSFSIHGIRHRFAVNHYKVHKDVVELQKLLGHSSLIATQAYLATLKSSLEGSK